MTRCQPQNSTYTYAHAPPHACTHTHAHAHTLPSCGHSGTHTISEEDIVSPFHDGCQWLLSRAPDYWQGRSAAQDNQIEKSAQYSRGKERGGERGEGRGERGGRGRGRGGEGRGGKQERGEGEIQCVRQLLMAMWAMVMCEAYLQTCCTHCGKEAVQLASM